MASASGPLSEFRFRRLQKPEEFRALQEVQRSTWGLQDEPPVSAPVQRAVQDNGGLVLGAFADVHLAGFALGTLGWDGTTLYHYSHLLAVRPEYQNHHLGIRLKVYQRDEVLQQGLPEVRWVFDPLSSRNAMVSVRKLGARITGYKVHYFGQPGNELDAGTESDRVTVTWPISDPRVEARLAARFPSAAEDQQRWSASSAIVETDAGESGLRVPSAVAEPSGASAHLEIPFDLGAIREHEPGALRTWRHAVRDAFRAASDLRYEVDDFAVISADHERRSFFLLRPRPPPAPPAGAPHEV